MSSHLTINSSQLLIDKSSASVAGPVPQSTDVGKSATSAQAGPSSGVSLPLEIVALIARSMQAAMVAEQAKTSSLPATSFTSGAIGGVGGGPTISTPTANVAQPSAGRPVSTSSVMVPSFVLTFTAPTLAAISLTVTWLWRACLQLLLRSWLINPFVVGPGISPVTVKLVFQIVAGKYIGLCDLLPMNMQVKEPELQFLFHNCLVLTSQPKKSH